MSKTGFLVITRIVCIVLLLFFTIGCSKIRYFNNSNTAGLAAGLEKYEEHDNIGLEMADGSKYLASGVSVEGTLYFGLANTVVILKRIISVN